MKHYWYCWVLFLALCSTSLYAHIGEQAHSFFMPRPVSTHGLLMAGSMFTAPVNENAESALSIEHTLFYHDSSDSDETVPYFLGKGKTSLRVDESEAGDLNSQWFNIASDTGSTYKSHLYIAPQRSLWGVAMRMQQSLGTLFDGLWAAVSVPFVEARHKLNVTEKIDSTSIVAGDSLFSSMTPSLDWDNWRAGKWSSSSQTISGVDDVCMQVGISLTGPWQSTQRVYTEISIPVGGYPTAQYLFEPIIGSAGSFGFGGGTASVIPLLEVGNHVHIMLINQAHYRYHFSTKQKRLADIKGQPFSRYIILMDTGLSANITNMAMKASNGVNFLARDAVVAPGATGQSVNGIEVRFRDHSLTTGYAYWWRAAEQVWFEKASIRSFAVPSPKGLVGGSPVWLPSPRIEDQFSVNDPTATTSAATLHDIDYDMDSAAAAHTASHTLFARYTGRFSTWLCDVQLSLGGAYEMADNSAALSMWQLWGGIGITV